MLTNYTVWYFEDICFVLKFQYDIAHMQMPRLNN